MCAQLLVFSQSLLSLDLIEEFLARASDQPARDSVDSQFGTWLPGKDYYRSDTRVFSDNIGKLVFFQEFFVIRLENFMKGCKMINARKVQVRPD